ncbi:hypothetical protein DC31_13985 [Microbacterium sp. CH12i]|uniref:hypothetical protein n=1 Tax=Microbacterium sp. CH12i TaxID=1479651 RepID=UPI000460A9EB|nr:hypothetical protein [Microbacterium sp. CH12i]KDA05870.1 hypothetical protein DC31_13985 [Microbacterium sp. CH12i]
MTAVRSIAGWVAIGILVAVVTIATLQQPTLGVAAVALLLFALWAWRHPVAAASTLAFLTAAFPKAGVRVADFPVPVFLFGLIVAVLIMRARSPRSPHGPVTLLIVGAFLTVAIARSLLYMQDGPAAVFAFVAWAALPVIILTLSTSMTSVDPRFIRAFQWGFLLSVAYALVQLAGGLDATAVPGLTHALGDDITEKHNIIYVTGGEDFSKIPSTYHNGNIYGLAAAFFLIFSLTRLFRGHGSRLDFATSVGAILAIGLSGSRTAIIAAAIPLFILLLQRGKLGWRMLVVAVGAVVVAGVLILEPDLAARYTIDSVLASGGSGRSAIWAQYLATMTPADFLFGTGSRAVVPDGWVGVVMQLGFVGTGLLVAAVVALMKRRPEWRIALVVLLTGAVIDSSYLTFPTWFIPAALMADTLTRPTARVADSIMRPTQPRESRLALRT